MAITSNGRDNPRRDAPRESLAVRTTTRCFSLVTLSSGQRRQILSDRARSDFDECQRLTVVADEIDFAF